ncbi:hypothetical protein ABZY05_23325 [Streptomyces canus]
MGAPARGGHLSRPGVIDAAAGAVVAGCTRTVQAVAFREPPGRSC